MGILGEYIARIFEEVKNRPVLRGSGALGQGLAQRGRFAAAATHQGLTMSASSRSLAVCVDDFGLHAGVNAAVLDLLALGRISAVSCLVDGVAWQEGALALKAGAYAETRRWTAGRRGPALNFTECLDPVAQAACPTHGLGALIQATYQRQLDQRCCAEKWLGSGDQFEAVWGRA